ncbi:MAG: TlyA family RNA methyltransferase [Firmicutes bacterium]|nr:TlyA family RNA methyltransferase [Bacillota bacterium]
MGSKKAKDRLDVLLVQKELFATREQAKAAVMAGQVIVNDQKVDKPGKSFDLQARIKVLEKPRYVSRGGLKLEKAVHEFGVDLHGRIVLDIGASTGGFTDCALQNGAQKVYAVDVGYGQLDWSLRNDPRVVVMERTNIRYLQPERLTDMPDFVTVDVSFISLTLVLPRVDVLTAPDAEGIALIKPQFEAGRGKVGKKGVVRDPAVHNEALNKIAGTVIDLGWGIERLDYSPVKGPEGNIEYLMHFKKNFNSAIRVQTTINSVIESAHLGLN